MVNIGKFRTNGTGTDNNHALGAFFQHQSITAADDGLAVEGESGDLARASTGSNENILTFHHGNRAILSRNLHLTGCKDAGGAAHTGDFVFLEEESYTVGEAITDGAGASNNSRPIHAELATADAVLRGMASHGIVHLGILQQCLSGDTAPVEAGTTHAFFFNANYTFTKLRSPDGTYVAGRSSANDDEIMLHALILLYSAPACNHEISSGHTALCHARKRRPCRKHLNQRAGRKSKCPPTAPHGIFSLCTKWN